MVATMGIPLLGALAQYLLCTSGGCAAVVLTDNSSLAAEVDAIEDSESIFRADRLPYLGVLMLYAVPWEGGWAAMVATNYALLLVATWIFRAVATTREGRRWATVAVTLNPVLWLELAWPSKDFALLALSALFSYAETRKGAWWKALSLKAALGALVFRDGIGAVLIVIWCIRRINGTAVGRRHLYASAVVAVVATMLYPVLARDIGAPIFSRNMAAAAKVAELYNSAAVSAVVEGAGGAMAVMWYVWRLVSNAVSQALLPGVILDDGGVYVAGVALWVYGVALAMGLAGSIADASRSQAEPAGVMALQAWMLVSVSAFPQPRYLMAFLPLQAMAAAASRRGRLAAVCAGIAVGAGALFLAFAEEVREAGPGGVIHNLPWKG